MRRYTTCDRPVQRLEVFETSSGVAGLPLSFAMRVLVDFGYKRGWVKLPQTNVGTEGRSGDNSKIHLVSPTDLGAVRSSMEEAA